MHENKRQKFFEKIGIYDIPVDRENLYNSPKLYMRP